jgi:predicted GNAT family acetyltransferase
MTARIIVSRGALDQIRAERMKVIPICPFVKAWIADHPEYRDLVQR